MHLKRAAAGLALVAVLLLAGCATPAQVADDVGPPVHLQAGAAMASRPASSADPSAHGEPDRVDGPVESGINPLQLPMAWARQAITITNDLGGAALVAAAVHSDVGRVTVQPSSAAGYRVEAVLEARGLTEQDARDALSRIDVRHSDRLGSRLEIATTVQRTPVAEPLPGISIGGGSTAWADIVLHLPADGRYDVQASSSSGRVEVADLRGPAFEASSSSGSVALARLVAGSVAAHGSSAAVRVEDLRADLVDVSSSSGSVHASGLVARAVEATSSSGSVLVRGAIDDLVAKSSSGQVTVEAHGLRSGTYDLGSSSGSVRLTVLDDGPRAYRVEASSSSGNVQVDLPDSRMESDEDDGVGGHVEAESRDFRRARIRTVVDASSSSGNVQVTA